MNAIPNIPTSTSVTPTKTFFNNISLSTMMIIIIVLLLIISIVVYVVVFYNKNKSTKQQEYISSEFYENQEHVPNDDKNISDMTMLYLYADWCEFCKRAKPEWELLKTKYEEGIVDGVPITFKEINCSQPNAENKSYMDKYNKEGSFPRFAISAGLSKINMSQTYIYEGKATFPLLDEFIKSVIHTHPLDNRFLLDS